MGAECFAARDQIKFPLMIASLYRMPAQLVKNQTPIYVNYVNLVWASDSSGPADKVNDAII
jgi:hypothetical protein